MRIRIRANASAPSTLTNLAQVRSVTDEIDKSDNDVSTVTAVDRAANLEIIKAATPEYALYGFALFYLLCLVLNWWYYLGPRAEIKNP